MIVLVVVSILFMGAVHVAGTRVLNERPGEWEKCIYPKSVYAMGGMKTVCYKRRMDGTVTCHQFCTSRGWGYVYKKCYGGWDTARAISNLIECDEVVDETRSADDKGKEVICYCSLS